MADPTTFLIIGFSILGIGFVIAMMMCFSKGFLVDLITIKKYEPPFNYSRLGANKNEI